MKLYEYQAKKLFSDFGISIPEGTVVSDASEAGGAIESVGLPLVVKAQVLVGGRGKAGGIRLARSREGALEFVQSLLGMELKGEKINSLLIERSVDYGRELYCSISIDRSSKGMVAMLSPEGGVDIEEIAATAPDKIVRQNLGLDSGFTDEQLSECASFLNLEEGSSKRDLCDLMRSLYGLFVEKDCSLVEINPLFVCENSRLVAGDAKIVLDDNALFRHPEFAQFADQDAVDPLEIEAKEKRLSYVKIGGNIGCIVNGAGLAMATMDLIKYYGGEPANFLDVGGASKSEQVKEALRIVTSSGKIDVVLVNIFGGIVRCDGVARGLLEATRELELSIPIIARLEGTNSQEAREMLEGTDLIMEPSMTLAAEKAVEISGSRKA